MGSPAETKINNLAPKIDRLIDWMLKNKPQQKEIHIFKSDYLWLKKRDPVIKSRGFHEDGDKIAYRGFTLLPYE